MKKIVTIGLLILIMSAGNVFALDNGFGVGGMIGEPSGATVKYIFGKYNAIDAGLDWSTWGTNAVELHADYLINNYTILKNLFNVEGENQFAYIGLGGRIKFADKIIFNNSLNSIGVRLPIGISYIFKDTPIELFLEIAFVLDVSPSTNFNLQGGVGARYYFF